MVRQHFREFIPLKSVLEEALKELHTLDNEQGIHPLMTIMLPSARFNMYIYFCLAKGIYMFPVIKQYFISTKK